MLRHARKERRFLGIQISGISDRNKLRLTAFLMVGFLASLGCNPASLTYFLIPPPKIPAKMPLTENKDDPTVVIVVSHTSQLQNTTELFNADRLIANRLTEVLKRQYKLNRKKVNIIDPYKVWDYRSSHPNWALEGPRPIGDHFKADYVINIEIDKMTLYQKKTHNLLYQGQAELSISVTDMNAPEGQSPRSEPYVTTFPATHPVSANDYSVGIFRSKFIDYMANDLSRYFSAHTTERKFSSLH